MREWKNFKSVIEKDPTDIESLHAYINSIQEERPESRISKNTLAVSRSNSNINSKSASKHEIAFEIDKAKLKKTTKEMIDAIMKNNREILKLEAK
jgi:hypothetical protein